MKRFVNVYRNLESIAVRQKGNCVELVSRCRHDPGLGVQHEYLSIPEFKRLTEKDPPSTASLIDSFQWVDRRHTLQAEYSDHEQSLIYTVPATFTVEAYRFPAFGEGRHVLVAPGKEFYLTLQGDHRDKVGSEFEVKDLMIDHTEIFVTFNLGTCTVTTCWFEGPKDYTRISKYLLRNNILKLVRHCPAKSWVITEPKTGRRVAVVKDSDNFLSSYKGGWSTHFRP